ncbi:hypothetical protein N431DRAFT_449053 [Stipitochalara longipes BDJ]|nr:hypothetical protein N431DRAFT_449053 [Stipitochalara longipes BDJ]
MDIFTSNLTLSTRQLIIETILQTHRIDQTYLKPRTVVYLLIFWFVVLRIACLDLMCDEGRRAFNEEGRILAWEAEQELENNGIVKLGEREGEMCGWVSVVGGCVWWLGLLG